MKTIKSGLSGSATNSIVWSAVKQRPFFVVSPAGPTDGGDYGPNTPGTTTGGIQEAFTAATAANGAMIWVKSGTYTFTSSISPPSNTEIHFEPGISLNWSAGKGILITGTAAGLVGVKMESSTVEGGLTNAPYLSFVTIDDTNGNVDDIIIDGFTIGLSTSTTAASVTFTCAGSALVGIANVVFNNCAFYGSEVVSNTTANQQGEPTEVYHNDCFFGSATQTSPLVHADMTGQMFYNNCCFVAYESNVVVFQLDGNAAIDQSTTAIILDGCQFVPASGLTGITFLSLLNNVSCGAFRGGLNYLEDNSPVLLLNLNATGAHAVGRNTIVFRDVPGYSSGGITLMNVNGAQSAESGSRLIFDNVGSNSAPAVLGTSFGQGQFNHVTNCNGLTDQGFVSGDTPTYTSTTKRTNNFPWAEDVYLTTAGMTSFVFTDLNSVTKTMTAAFLPGFICRLLPGESITPTGAGAAWAWKRAGP